MFQRIHRWRKARGAKAGEGRRDQHLLRGLGASVWEVPQVSVRDVTCREEGLSYQPKSLKTNIPSSSVYKDFWFQCLCSPSSVATSVFILLPPQDHDAVSSEKHQNSSQVLVPQELPVPDFQGRISFFFPPTCVILKISGLSSWMWRFSLTAGAFSPPVSYVSFKQERSLNECFSWLIVTFIITRSPLSSIVNSIQSCSIKDCS